MFPVSKNQQIRQQQWGEGVHHSPSQLSSLATDLPLASCLGSARDGSGFDPLTSHPSAKKAAPARTAVPQAWEYQRLYCRTANRHWSRRVAASGIAASGGLGYPEPACALPPPGKRGRATPPSGGGGGGAVVDFSWWFAIPALLIHPPPLDEETGKAGKIAYWAEPETRRPTTLQSTWLLLSPRRRAGQFQLTGEKG